MVGPVDAGDWRLESPCSIEASAPGPKENQKSTMSDRPPQWGEPGYKPPPPTYAQRAARRNLWRLLTLIFGAGTALFLALGVYGSFVIEPGQDTFGVSMSLAFAFYGIAFTAIFAWLWHKVSKAIRRKEYR
jgi:hypothetical protein